MSHKKNPADLRSARWFAPDDLRAFGHRSRAMQMGYAPEDTHLWTQGEPIEARHWYPSFDSPNEKFTSEVICRVPDGMVVLSNGKLMSEEKDAGTCRALAFQ